MDECVDTVEHAVIADDETAGTWDLLYSIILYARSFCEF